MKSDHDRIRTGIELMTAYASGYLHGDDLLAAYVAERRKEDPAAAEDMLDGVAALCALLIRRLSGMTGQSDHEILQQYAQATHRHERESRE